MTKEKRELINLGERIAFTLKTEGWTDIQEYLDEKIEQSQNLAFNGVDKDIREENRMKCKTLKDFVRDIKDMIENSQTLSEDKNA